MITAANRSSAAGLLPHARPACLAGRGAVENHEAVEGHFEGARQAKQRADGRVLFAVLEAADVGAVEPRGFRQLLLRPAPGGPQFLDATPQSLEVIAGRRTTSSTR